MRRYRSGGMGWRARLVCAAAVLAALYMGIMRYVRPKLLDYAENYAVHTASFALYDVLTDEVYAHREEYAGLVTFEHDADNAVTALRTDGILADRLKVQAARAVYEALDGLERTTVEVPAGTILWPDLFAGRGPTLRVGMAGLGCAQAEFLSAFTDAGINQTRHQVVLEVSGQVRILTALGARNAVASTRLVVSDTVIVGRVPESYTYIDDTEQSLLGKINDYAESSN